MQTTKKPLTHGDATIFFVNKLKSLTQTPDLNNIFNCSSSPNKLRILVSAVRQYSTNFIAIYKSLCKEFNYLIPHCQLISQVFLSQIPSCYHLHELFYGVLGQLQYTNSCNSMTVVRAIESFILLLETFTTLAIEMVEAAHIPVPSTPIEEVEVASAPTEQLSIITEQLITENNSVQLLTESSSVSIVHDSPFQSLNTADVVVSPDISSELITVTVTASTTDLIMLSVCISDPSNKLSLITHSAVSSTLICHSQLPLYLLSSSNSIYRLLQLVSQHIPQTRPPPEPPPC